MNLRNYEPTVFRQRLRRHLYQHRALLEECDPQARVAPMYEHWTEGIFPPLQALAEQVLPLADRHDYLAALDSSQAFALNLLLPFRLAGARALEQVLRARLSKCLHIKDFIFEFVGPTHVLSETHGPQRQPDEPVTSVDCAVWVQDEHGRNGMVLIEVKLAEGGFSTCNGLTSRGNRSPDVCASLKKMFSRPDECYLTHPYRATRDRRYWAIFEKRYGSLKAAFPGSEQDGSCPFAGHFQQPMRNHALALGLVQSGFCDFAYFGLLHHDYNPDVVPHWDQYCEMVAEPQMLFKLNASELVDAAPHSGWWTKWAHYMRNRYALSLNN